MGYYTRFKLEVYDAHSQEEVEDHEEFYGDIHSDLSDESGYINPFEEECKWYSWEDDAQKISKQYPNHYILIRGYGEEGEDVWAELFLNGESKANWHLKVDEPSINELLKQV